MHSLLRRNWKSKILALSLACTVWFYVYAFVHAEVSVQAPLTVTPPDGFLAALSAETARFSFVGQAQAVEGFAVAPILGHYRIDSGASPQSMPVEMQVSTGEFLRLPPGIYLAGVPSPPTVTISLFPAETRWLKVQPRLEREVPGASVSFVSVKPSAVRVTMPSAAPQNRVVHTEPIPVFDLAAGEFEICTRLPSCVDGYPVEYPDAETRIVVGLSVRQEATRKVRAELRVTAAPGTPIPAFRVVGGFPEEVEMTGLPESVGSHSQVIAYLDLPESREKRMVLRVRTEMPADVRISPPLPASLELVEIDSNPAER